MKRLSTILATVIFSMLMVFSSFAGEWKSNNVGLWWWEYSDGTYAANCWENINNKWYYFDGTGYMATNKWIGDYYVGADGAMLVNCSTPDGAQVGADGKRIVEQKSDNRTTSLVLGKYRSNWTLAGRLSDTVTYSDSNKIIFASRTFKYYKTENNADYFRSDEKDTIAIIAIDTNVQSDKFAMVMMKTDTGVYTSEPLILNLVD